MTDVAMDTMQQRFDMHLNYYFFDIQCKGTIPYYLDRYFEQKNIQRPYDEEDLRVLAEGTVDFVSFSWYMSNISAYQGEPMQRSALLPDAKKQNPYLKMTDWVQQVIQRSLFLLKTNCFTEH